MQTSVTFKKFDPSEPLKLYVQEKLDRFDRYLDNPAEANVILSVEKFRHIAEINLIGDRLNINSKEETDDMYSAIDMVLDKLEKQIKKNKQKVKERRPGGRRGKGGAAVVDAAAAAVAATAPDIPEREIVVENIDYKPMDVEEAAMLLEMDDNQFLVFTNGKTGRVNVLYRRSDGHFGLIQPGG